MTTLLKKHACQRACKQVMGNVLIHDTGERKTHLVRHDGAETSNHAIVVLGRLQLDTSLHHVKGGHTRMRDAAANTAGQRSLEIVVQIIHLCATATCA
jgi:hypothetical protein